MKLVNAETLQHNLLRKAQSGFVLVETIRDTISEEAEIMVPYEGVLEEPEKAKGTWKRIGQNKSMRFECTACGNIAYYPRHGSGKDTSPNVCEYPLCPHCGAQMEV